MDYLVRLGPYAMFVLGISIFTCLNYYQIGHLKADYLWQSFLGIARYNILRGPILVIGSVFIQFAFSMLSSGKGANKLWMTNAAYTIIGLLISIVATKFFYNKLPSRNMIIGVVVISLGVFICNLKK